MSTWSQRSYGPWKHLFLICEPLQWIYALQRKKRERKHRLSVIGAPQKHFSWRLLELTIRTSFQHQYQRKYRKFSSAMQIINQNRPCRFPDRCETCKIGTQIRMVILPKNKDNSKIWILVHTIKLLLHAMYQSFPFLGDEELCFWQLACKRREVKFEIIEHFWQKWKSWQC